MTNTSVSIRAPLECSCNARARLYLCVNVCSRDLGQIVAKYFLFNLFPPPSSHLSARKPAMVLFFFFFFNTIALFMCKAERVKTVLMIHESLTHKSLLNRSSIIYSVTTVSNDVPSLKCSHISSYGCVSCSFLTLTLIIFTRGHHFFCLSKPRHFLHATGVCRYLKANGSAFSLER